MMQASVISEKGKCPRQNFKLKSLHWFHTFGDIWHNSVYISAVLKGAQIAKTPNPLIHKGCIFTNSKCPPAYILKVRIRQYVPIWLRFCNNIEPYWQLVSGKGSHPWILFDPNAHRQRGLAKHSQLICQQQDKFWVITIVLPQTHTREARICKRGKNM